MEIVENWTNPGGPLPVVIIGGGAAGVLSAIALLRSNHRAVVLVERDPTWSTGPAYATQDPKHLLNVPASKLSVDSTRPCDFVEWATARVEGVTPCSFLPRRLFGEYLRDSLAAAARDAGPTALTRINGDVVSLDRACVKKGAAAGVRVDFGDGRSIVAAHVVLALGNPSTRVLAADAGAAIENPWSVCGAEPFGTDDSVLIVGTGLTAVDVAVTLAGRGHRGPITMVSRHGLLPRAHESAGAVPLAAPALAFAPTACATVAWLRAEIAGAGGDWRSVFDAVRHHTNEIWARLPDQERARLLRHVTRFWEVHRHRIAPVVAAEIDGLLAAGRITIVRGAVTRVERAGGTSRVTVRDARGAHTTLAARRLINCTGPNFDLRGSAGPLVQDLFDRGAARPGPLGLGLDVTGDGSLVDRAARASSTVSVVGPLRRGAEWETTAIPDIRAHAEALAERLAPAHSAGRARTGRLHELGAARRRRPGLDHAPARVAHIEVV